MEVRRTRFTEFTTIIYILVFTYLLHTSSLIRIGKAPSRFAFGHIHVEGFVLLSSLLSG
jgi:hypothetical protein